MARQRSAENAWVPPQKYAIRGIDARNIPDEIWQVMEAKTAMWNDLIGANHVHAQQYCQFLELDEKYTAKQQELTLLREVRDAAFVALKAARQLHRVKSGPAIIPFKQAYDDVRATLKVKSAEVTIERTRVKEGIEYAAYRETAKKAWNTSRKTIYADYGDRLSVADKCDIIDRFEKARLQVMKRPGATFQPKEYQQDFIRLCDENHDSDGLPWKKLVSIQDMRPTSSSSFRFLVRPPVKIPKTTKDKRIPALFRVGKAIIQFDVVVHRPFPSGAIVKNIILTGRKDPYGRWSWSIVFNLNVPIDETVQTSKHDDRNGEATGIDIGWRQEPNGLLRVATVAYPSEYGYITETIYLPRGTRHAVTEADEYLIALQKRIDAVKNEVKIKIQALKDRVPPGERGNKIKIVELKTLDTWDQYATDDLKRWISGLAKMGARGLTRGIRLAELAGMDILLNLLSQWQHDTHRFARERYGVYQRRQRQLTNFYQQAAQNIVQRSERVAIETLPLDRMAQGKIAGGGRQRASLSTFRHWLDHYGKQDMILVKKVFAGKTSQLCAICGADVLPAYKGAEYQMCANGHTFHRDENAAINIARRGSKLPANSQEILGTQNPLTYHEIGTAVDPLTIGETPRRRRHSEMVQMDLQF